MTECDYSGRELFASHCIALFSNSASDVCISAVCVQLVTTPLPLNPLSTNSNQCPLTSHHLFVFKPLILLTNC